MKEVSFSFSINRAVFRALHSRISAASELPPCYVRQGSKDVYLGKVVDIHFDVCSEKNITIFVETTKRVGFDNITKVDFQYVRRTDLVAKVVLS